MADTKLQVFTYDNLALYDELLKGYVDAEDAKSLKTVAIDGNTLKFYRVSEPVGDTAPAYTINLPETDLSGLIPKITGATVDNIVAVAENGEVKDSGVAIDSLATDEELKAVSDLVGVIPDGYEATTIAAYAKELADNVAANGYDDTELSEKVTANTEAITELETNKADKATTVAGYGITDAYTKTEVDSAITTAVANAEHLKRSIVDVLPEVSSADTHTIYMVAITGGNGNQKYEEFMLINGAFEKIGDSAVDLTDYATKTEVATAKSEANTYADGLNTAMDTRVAALEGLVGEGFEPISAEAIANLFS